MTVTQDTLVEPGTPLPWAYRPQEHDDWGVIRTTVASESGWTKVIAQVRYDGEPTQEDLNRHRKDGTDPAEKNARYIVHTANTYPALIARIEQLEATLARQTEAAGKLAALLRRYRDETPPGHSPHMICHQADAALQAWETRHDL